MLNQDGSAENTSAGGFHVFVVEQPSLTLNNIFVLSAMPSTNSGQTPICTYVSFRHERSWGITNLALISALSPDKNVFKISQE